MSELKSAKTFSAEASRPFSDRTLRRLRRMGEDDEGRMVERAFDRSLAERVGFSAVRTGIGVARCWRRFNRC